MEGLSGGVGVVAVGAVGGGSTISSPTGVRTGGASVDRKRNLSIAGLDSSPGSVEEGADDDIGDDRRRTPVVKRACNECRQQKLRCNVVQEPFMVCARCDRLKLQCKIESNFKRVGKRSKNAEMEREIVELRRQLASSHSQGSSIDHQQPSSFSIPQSTGNSPEIYQQPQHQSTSLMGSDEAVASLLDLKQGLDGSGAYLKAQQGPLANVWKLGLVTITEERITELFEHFFTFNHPFLPILDSTKSPDYYYKTPLLFWTIVTTGARRFPAEPNLFLSLAPELSKLVWSTLAEVPQSYHVVKALCLICTWPLPISSTSSDATFMLSGVMTHVAMQIGLHRPSHAQDFSKFHVQLREEELKDRVKTWAACNIVAQSVATGYGQPPQTVYDWTLKPTREKQISYQLPEELEARLLIEKFCDGVTKGLYSNENDPVGLIDDTGRSALSKILSREFAELEARVGSLGSPTIQLHLRAAELHFRLSAFFDSSTAKDYQHDLLSLYWATTSFLKCALSLEPSTIYTPSSSSSGSILSCASNYILQMMIAGGFTLLKLLNSFFASHIDLDEGRTLFNRTIWAIRKISIMPNDLPSRLAEVLAQLWRGGGEGAAKLNGRGSDGKMDGSLQLKVRCRMSMSLVYDSVWRWREEFQAKGRGNLDSAVKNPTNPDSTADTSSASLSNTTSSAISLLDSTHPSSSSLTPIPQPLNGAASSLMGTNAGYPPGGAVTPGPSNSFGESNYEVFDPLNWMLDGFVDWPFSFIGPGNGQGGPGPGVEAAVGPG